MDSSSSRDHELMRHWIWRALGLATAATLAAACGGKVVFEEGDDTGGGAGGSTASSGTTGSTSATTGSSAAATTGTGAPPPLECGDPTPGADLVKLCLPGSNGQGCPAVSEVEQQLFQQVVGSEKCVGSGTCCDLLPGSCGPDPYVMGQCCYLIAIDFYGCEGRPFTVAGEAGREARTASIARRSDWLGPAALPDLAGLDAATLAALTARFEAAALDEHASVASFARFALELMSLGAPADLVASAVRAMGDEVRHAEICFSLASAYAGTPRGPSALEMGGAVRVGGSLADLAVATALEGCVNETIAALIVAAERDRATDGAVRAALASIAADEAAHAELAWRTVAWALAAGDPAVAPALERAFGSPGRLEPRESPSDGADRAALSAHGALSREEKRAIAERALRDVVLPCAMDLLASRRPGADRAVAWQRGC